MEFMVRRTSLWWDDEMPCEEAYLKEYVFIDTRSVDCPTKVPAYKGKSDWWYEEGMNHRVEDGKIKRDFIRKGWFITINSIEELLEFVNKYGDIVVQKALDNDKLFEIEIYDDYRE